MESKLGLVLAMYMIEISCEFVFSEEILVKHSAQFEQILMKGLSHTDLDLQVASFKSLTVFMMEIYSEAIIQKFGQSVIPIMITKMIELIRQDQLMGQ